MKFDKRIFIERLRDFVQKHWEIFIRTGLKSA
jgi:hypothetical protein